MKVSFLDVLLCTVVLTAIVAGTYGLLTVLVPFTVRFCGEYHVVVDAGLAVLFYGLLSALVVRIFWRIHPIAPGEYSMESNEFTYWKLLNILYRLGQAALLPFTTVFLRPVVQSLYGARIGANVAIGGAIDDPFLVTVGEGAVLGHHSLVSGNMIVGGKLVIGAVKIGAGVTIGVNCVVLPDTEIGDNAKLVGGSFVLNGTRIPAGENWRGKSSTQVDQFLTATRWHRISRGPEKQKAPSRTGLFENRCSGSYFVRRRSAPAPKRPRPTRASEAGSGTTVT